MQQYTVHIGFFAAKHPGRLAGLLRQSQFSNLLKPKVICMMARLDQPGRRRRTMPTEVFPIRPLPYRRRTC